MHGIAKLELRSAEFIDGKWVAGEVIDTLENHNEILYARHSEYFRDSNYTTYQRSDRATSRLWISEYWNEGPCSPAIGEIYGTLLEETFTAKTTTTGAYWTFKHRWDPPADNVVRRLKSVGLYTMSIVSLGTEFLQYGRNVSLGIQPQILDVTYRLYISDGTTDFTCYPYAAPYLASYFNYGGTQDIYNNSVWPRSLLFQPWCADADVTQKISYRMDRYNTGNRTNVRTTSGSRRDFDPITYMRADWSSLTADVGGLVATAFVHGNGYPITEPVALVKPNMSAVQNTFGRSPGNDKPYLDVDHLATGSGTVTIDDLNGWQRDCDLAKKYRILITSSGNQTTATYKVLKREWTGGSALSSPFAFNLIKSLPQIDTNGEYMQAVDGKVHRAHGAKWNIYNGWWDGFGGDQFVQPYIYPEFITADASGISICHISKPWQNVDVNSAIPLPVGSVSQIQHTADGTIYVACASTGLWKVERTLGTPVNSVTAVTRITVSNAEDDTKCRGFQIKRGDGSFWAIFGREMCKSTDNGVTWTVYNESTTPQFKLLNVTDNVDYATRIVCCHIDPNNANNQFMIPITSSYTDTDTGGAYYWWSEGASSPTTDALYGDNNILGVSTRLFASRAIYCTQTGRWLMHWPRGTTTSRIFASYKATASSYYSNLGRDNWAGDQYGGPMLGMGPNVFFGADGNEYTLGFANNSTTITAGNPAGENFSRHVVAYNINTLNLSIGSVNSAGIGREWSHYVGYLLPSGTHYPAWDTIVYIGNGVCVMSGGDNSVHATGLALHLPGPTLNQGVTLGFWKQYGWNGSAWVEGNSNSRTVHTSREALIDGLHITFGTGNYVDNEWYDTYVYKGILKDDATTFTFSTEVFKTATFATSNFSLNGGILTTVPAANVGTVVNEPMTAMMTPMYYASDNNTVEATGSYSHLEPGAVGAYGDLGTSPTRYSGVVFSEKLEGDYKVSFRLAQLGGGNAGSIMGVKPYNNDSLLSALHSSTRTHKQYIRIYRTTNDATRALHVFNFGTSTAIFVSANFTNPSISDVYAIQRQAGVITYLRNDVVLYTSAVTDTTPHQFFLTHSGNNWSNLKDLKVNYTINRRYLDIGNGISTGRADPNFRKIIASSTVADKVNAIFLDGVPATLNFDSYTPPGPGQVTVMEHSGRLWFNEADAGKTVTGTITYVKKLNRSGVTPELDNNIYIDVKVAQGENFYGSGPKFFLNNVETPDLSLIPGKTYVFRVNDASCTGYNFRFSVTPDGDHRYRGVDWPARTVSGTAGTTGAYVSMVAPDTSVKLYYYDTVFQGMGNDPGVDWVMPVDETFTVTVANPGSGNKFYIDGNPATTLALKQGGRYKFVQSDSSNAGHPIRFSLTSGGTHNLGTQIKTGVYNVGTPGSNNAYTILEVFEGHDNVYYYCSNHANMGGICNTNTDRHWDKVTLLTHLDGTAGTASIAASTTTVSPFNSVTLTGNALLDSTQSKFGGASIILDGTDDDVYIATDSNSVFTDQYTFEMWFRPTVQMSTVDDVLFCNNNHASAGYNYFQPGGVNGSTGADVGKARLQYGGTGYFTKRNTDVLFPINTWVHVALVRDSRYNVRLYINGVLEIDVTNSSWVSNLQNIRVGRYYNGNNDCTGFVDEIRYTKNVARYQGISFPVQIAQFPNS